MAATSDENPLSGLVHTVKTEIVEVRNAVISSSVYISNCNNLGDSSSEQEGSADVESYCSTSKFLHPCPPTEMGCHKFSPSTVSQTGASLLADISQSVNKVKSDSLGKAAAYVSVYDPVFIGKFSDPGNSSGQEHERFVEGGFEHGDPTSFTSKVLDFCSNEVSFEFMEADSCISLPKSNEELLDCHDGVSVEFMEADNCTNIPEGGEENCGENIELDSSERSCNNFSPSSKSESPTLYADNPQLISAATELISDVYSRASRFNVTMMEVENLMNQVDNLGRTDNHEWKSESDTLDVRMSRERENGGDEICDREMPTCSHEDNVTTEHSLPHRDIHDLHRASGFSEEVCLLDSLVLKALCGDARRNINEDCFNSVPFSSCNSQAGNDSLPGTDRLCSSTVDQAYNLDMERTSSFGEIDAEEHINSQIEKCSLVGTCDPCVPQHLDTSFNSVQQLHPAGMSFSETESSHCSTMNQVSESCLKKEANSDEGDAADLVQELDSCSPDLSPPDSGAVDGLLNAEVCSSHACKENQSSAVKTLCPQVDMQTCFSPETPKKLLSNRKVRVLLCSFGLC